MAGPYPVQAKGRAGSGFTTPSLTLTTLLICTRTKPMYSLVHSTGYPVPRLSIVGTLPAGLSFIDAANGWGAIYGTPTVVATTGISVRATNSQGTDTVPVSIQVVAEPTPATEIPATIDKTGATDVTAALNSFFAAMANGSPGNLTVIQLPAGANYRIDGTVLIESKSYFVIRAPSGGRFFAGTSGAENPSTRLTRSQLRFNKCDHFVVDGLEVEGYNHPAGVSDANFYNYTTGGIEGQGSYAPSYETQNAIDLKGAVHFEIRNCDLHHTFGDGIYMGRDLGAAPHRVCQSGWIHDNDIHHTGRQLLGAGGAADIVVELNTLREGRRTVFDVEPLGTDETVWRGDNIHFIDNDIGNHWLNFFSNKGNSPNCDTIVIARNTAVGTGKCKHVIYLGSVSLSSASQPGYPGYRRANYWIVDNDGTLSGQDHDQIFAQRIDGLVVHGNIIPTQSNFPMGNINYCSALSFHDNTVAPSTNEYDDVGTTGGTPISETPPSPPAAAGRPTSLYP